MIDDTPQEIFCTVDYDPVNELIDACALDIARLGDDMAAALHCAIFGLHPAQTPWAAYCETIVHGMGVTVQPSYRLIRYADLLGRAGWA